MRQASVTCISIVQYDAIGHLCADLWLDGVMLSLTAATWSMWHASSADYLLHALPAHMKGGWEQPVFLLLLQEATIFELPPNLGMPGQLGTGEQVQFPEAAYSLGPGSQGDFDSCILRIGYTSLTTPTSTIDLNMKTGNRYGMLPQTLFASPVARLSVRIDVALHSRQPCMCQVICFKLGLVRDPI